MNSTIPEIFWFIDIKDQDGNTNKICSTVHDNNKSTKTIAQRPVTMWI